METVVDQEAWPGWEAPTCDVWDQEAGWCGHLSHILQEGQGRHLISLLTSLPPNQLRTLVGQMGISPSTPKLRGLLETVSGSSVRWGALGGAGKRESWVAGGGPGGFVGRAEWMDPAGLV